MALIIATGLMSILDNSVTFTLTHFEELNVWARIVGDPLVDLFFLPRNLDFRFRDVSGSFEKRHKVQQTYIRTAFTVTKITITKITSFFNKMKSLDRKERTLY